MRTSKYSLVFANKRTITFVVRWFLFSQTLAQISRVLASSKFLRLIVQKQHEILFSDATLCLRLYPGRGLLISCSVWGENLTNINGLNLNSVPL